LPRRAPRPGSPSPSPVLPQLISVANAAPRGALRQIGVLIAFSESDLLAHAFSKAFVEALGHLSGWARTLTSRTSGLIHSIGAGRKTAYGADLPLLRRPTNAQDCPFGIPSANTTTGIPVLKLEGGRNGQLELNRAARGLSREQRNSGCLSGQPAPTRASRKPAQCNQSSRDSVPLRGPCRVAGE
jgi:hypothetical protein